MIAACLSPTMSIGTRWSFFSPSKRYQRKRQTGPCYHDDGPEPASWQGHGYRRLRRRRADADVRVALFETVTQRDQDSPKERRGRGGPSSSNHRRAVAPQPLRRAMGAGGETLGQSATTYAAPLSATIDLTTAAMASPRTLEVCLAREGSGVAARRRRLHLARGERDHGPNCSSSQAPLASRSATSRNSTSRASSGGHHFSGPYPFRHLRRGIPPTLAASVASLPATGIDPTFTSNVLSGVFAHSRAALSQA